MNGRCETDPFDGAVDVCRTCYGEFCWNCLVETKPNKPPMCRECALIIGGLRPKTKPKIKGDKKTVKARRERLREAREQPRHGVGFSYFDVAEPFDEGFDPAGGGRGEDVAEDDDGPDSQRDEQADSDPVSPEVTDSPAIRRLTTIRNQADAKLPAEAVEPVGSEQSHPVPDEPSVSAEDREIAEEEPLVAEFRKPRRYIDQHAGASAGQASRPEEPTDQPDQQPSPPPVATPAATAEEPVHINDDPWARTGPEAVSTTHALPRRRPDPKPSEDGSDSPPGWTKANLPKRK